MTRALRSLILLCVAIPMLGLWGCGTKTGIVTENSTTFCYDQNGDFVKGKFVVSEHEANAESYVIWYFSRKTGEGSRFNVGKVNDHITAIVEPSSPIIYVIEGQERALVVDAGTGVGDIDELIQLVTDKPYTMWLTHGHYDHVGGAYSADCDIFFNEPDREIETLATAEARLDYSQKRGARRIDVSDLAPYKQMEYKTLHTGDSIDLGGYTVEALFLGGHTTGHHAFLCVEERILITGDSANHSVSLTSNESLSVEEYLDNLKELKNSENRWDKLLKTHHSFSFIEKSLIDELIALCQEIVDNGSCSEEVCLDETTGAYQTQKSDSIAQISYYKSKIKK